ncbi:MAG: hypothetical protein ACREH8_20040 [Opitutaceae bacterium]
MFRNVFVAAIAFVTLCSLPAFAADATPPPRSPALPPHTVLIGKGGLDGFMTVGAEGTIHVIYGGKYRCGRAPDQLGSEETITDVGEVNGVRLTIDATGRPHAVFSTGVTAAAKRSYYTARVHGCWLPAEKFADAADFPERSRAYVADVAADEESKALVCFWVSRPIAQRAEFENPSFYYRWRSRDGRWSAPQSLPAAWSSAPKVEYEPVRGFYLLWQFRQTDWRIGGPVRAGEAFAVEESIPTGSANLTGLTTVQNEGADFSRGAKGTLVVAGNVREKFHGPVGVWATVGDSAKLAAAVYLGGFPGTKRGDESGLHPVTAFDAATGAAFVTVMDPATKRACVSVYRRDTGWQRTYVPLLPGHVTPQGTLRQGPSVADLPGPGVVALIRDGEQCWYLRTLTSADASEPRASREKP